MDLQSYIELKKKYASMQSPQPISEEVESVDEEILSEEDLDESRLSGPQRRERQRRIRAEREANSKNQTGNVFTRAQAELDKANEAERQRQQERRPTGTGQGNRSLRRNLGSGSSTSAPAGAPGGARFSSPADEKRQAARAAGQDPDKIGGGSSSGSSGGRGAKGSTQGSGNNGGNRGGTSTVTRTVQPSRDYQAEKEARQRAGGGSGGGGSRPSGSTRPPAASTPKPTPQKQTGDKAKDMATWAKANPKLAAAQKQRAATRGTTASSNPLMKGLGRAPKPTPTAAPKPTTTPKATPFKPSGSSSATKFNPSAPKIKLNNSVEVDSFDIILEYLVGSGFPEQEALVIMAEMSEEKREQILEEMKHREADTGKVVDKAEVGKTYYPHGERKKSSVALRKEKEAAKKKTHKEEVDSLRDAYNSVFASKEEISEEEADKLRDKRQERGGVDGNKRYPGFASATEMKKHGVPGAKTAAQREAEEKYGKGATAMDIVKAQMEKKYGKGAVMDPKDKKKKD